jgi:hypothetical protein
VETKPIRLGGVEGISPAFIVGKATIAATDVEAVATSEARS